MNINLITIAKLAVATLFPAVLSAGVYQAERRTFFARWKGWIRQILIGILFGGVAVLGTEYAIPAQGVLVSVRNAAPLTAGLLFGPGAGILAGIIGGAYRWAATAWGAGEFSRAACSVACLLAGTFGAVCRKFMFDNKKASWFYGLAIGITTEVLHMLLVFITNLNDIEGAFRAVAVCAAPMILCNGVSVMLALRIVSVLGREKVKETNQYRQISQVFQYLLLICVAVAFAATCIFTNTLQTRLAYSQTENLLTLNLNDIKEDIREASDENLLKITRLISAKVTSESTSETLLSLCDEYDVAGINIVDENGIIKESTIASFVGFDMASGEQSGEFLCLLDGDSEYVQSYQPLSIDGDISRKYAGIALSDGGFVQVGYDASQFQTALSEQITTAVKNRHVGRSGGIIVCDENLTVIADNGGHTGESVVRAQNVSTSTGEVFTASVAGVDCYCIYDVIEGFYLISTLPESEAMFSRDLAVCILMFMEIIVFAALFVQVYFLIKSQIVDNIHKINDSLAEITGGNLNIHVNVRENEEFASLSDDINATVDTLKHYIAEAESRIDRELEFARQIQRSSLPSVFPPYPDRTEFSVYGMMEAAKEVGGDFFDFYMTDRDHITFIVADVSGKGIPGALFMMRSKTLIKNLAESGRSIDEVFREANRTLCENNEAEMFVTAWMGRLDLTSGVLEFVNAGHNPPLIRRANGETEYLRTKPNFVLAGLNGIKYQKHETVLGANDEIFVYTDGVTEAADSENVLYGEERLLKALCRAERDPEKVCETVRDDIREFVRETEQSDDITMLCLKLNPRGKRAEFSAEPTKKSIEAAASFLEDTLAKWETPSGCATNAKIILDEVYSNIVFYSGAKKAKITVEQDDEKLTLTFADNGTPYDPTAAADPNITLPAAERDPGGLGIFLVKKLSSAVRYGNENGENRLTAELALHANKK